MASATSGYGFVRAKLLSLQQDMAAQHNVIMDGRDIGTCVLPNAQLKNFPDSKRRGTCKNAGMMSWWQKENSVIWQRLKKISVSVITVTCTVRSHH